MIYLSFRNNWNTQLYRTNQEMNAIADAVDPEFADRVALLQVLYDRTRASIADERGVSQWERIFRIIPNLHTDTLEYRRERLLQRMAMSPPFTALWAWTVWLPKLFPDHVIPPPTVDWRRLWMWVDVPVADVARLREFRAELAQIIPANLLLFVRRMLGPVDVDKIQVAKVALAVRKPIIHGSMPQRRPALHHLIHKPTLTLVGAKRPIIHGSTPMARLTLPISTGNYTINRFGLSSFGG